MVVALTAVPSIAIGDGDSFGVVATMTMCGDGVAVSAVVIRWEWLAAAAMAAVLGRQFWR